MTALLLGTCHFAESPKRRRGGERDFPGSFRQRGQGKRLSPAQASCLRCCALAGTAASSARETKQRAEPAAHTHTHAHTRAHMHMRPNTRTASMICAAALSSPELLKPLENPSPMPGNRSYLPFMHLNTGNPQKDVPAPQISLDVGTPQKGSPAKGSFCSPGHGTFVVWAMDRLLTPRSTFPAVIRASPVRSTPDGDFSTFVALLPHLPSLIPPAIQGCPGSTCATLGHPEFARYPQGPRPPWPQPSHNPGPYLEEEDDTGAAGSAQHPLVPALCRAPCPGGGFSCPSGWGLWYPGG